MSNSKVDNLEKRVLCVTMINAGFKNSVIEIFCGISNSMIRSIRSELGVQEQSKNGEKANSGQLRVSHRIVDNRRRVIDAGIILNAYLKLAQFPSRSIDITALIDAHQFYLETHRDIYGRDLNPIDINEAFVLVRDYRSNNGSIMLHSCHCGADYVTVDNQRMAAGCPACSLERKTIGLANDDFDDEELEASVDEAR